MGVPALCQSRVLGGRPFPSRRQHPHPPRRRTRPAAPAVQISAAETGADEGWLASAPANYTAVHGNTNSSQSELSESSIDCALNTEHSHISARLTNLQHCVRYVDPRTEQSSGPDAYKSAAAGPQGMADQKNYDGLEVQLQAVVKAFTPTFVAPGGAGGPGRPYQPCRRLVSGAAAQQARRRRRS